MVEFRDRSSQPVRRARRARRLSGKNGRHLPRRPPRRDLRPHPVVTGDGSPTGAAPRTGGVALPAGAGTMAEQIGARGHQWPRRRARNSSGAQNCSKLAGHFLPWLGPVDSAMAKVDLHALRSSIHAAGLRPTLWPETMAQLGRAVGEVKTHLFSVNLATGLPLLAAISGFNDDALQAIEDHFGRNNPWTLGWATSAHPSGRRGPG